MHSGTSCGCAGRAIQGMSTITHLAGTPALILAGCYAFKTVVQVVLQAVALGHGDVAKRAETVLRIVFGRGRL